MATTKIEVEVSVEDLIRAYATEFRYAHKGVNLEDVLAFADDLTAWIGSAGVDDEEVAVFRPVLHVLVEQ